LLSILSIEFDDKTLSLLGKTGVEFLVIDKDILLAISNKF